MTKKTGAYIVMIAGLILLIINIYELDFSNLKNVPFSGIALNVLLIFRDFYGFQCFSFSGFKIINVSNRFFV